MKVLDADQVRLALEAMRETTIYPQIALLLLTGMRRGELMGLQWRDIDFEAKRIRVERSVEKTKAGGLRLKEPKTSHGRRAIALSDVGIEILREHRKATLERRLALALGRLADDAFVFGAMTARSATRIALHKTGRGSRRHAACRRSRCIPSATVTHLH